MATTSTQPGCREQRALFFHLHRGELDEATATAVRRHLESCEACRRFDEVEAAFDRVLARSLPRATLPDDVRRRLDASLDRARRVRERPARPAWVQGLAAAAILVVGMMVPGAVDRFRSGPPLPAPGAATAADLAEVEWTGMMVDDECDRQGLSIAAQRDCEARHHTVFKTGRGEYLTLVPGEVAELPVLREDRGTKLRIRGRYDPRAGTLQLISLEKL